MKRALVALVALTFVLTDAASAVETPNDSVVLFTSRKSGSPMIHGGGVIVGADDHAIYIATVEHVVTIEDLRVQFYAARGKDYLAHVFPESETAEEDFAVVSVEVAANDPIRRSLRALPYRTSKLAANTPVFHIGHSGSAWDMVTGNYVLRDQLNHVYFTSRGIAAASSGGPVFDDKSRLVGLVTQVAATDATTLKVEVILFYLREWNVPMNLLGEPPAPKPTEPTKSPAGGNLVLVDRFDNNRNGWYLSSDAEFPAQVTGGVYQVGAKTDPRLFPLHSSMQLDQERDFEIRVSGRRIQGTDRTTFGIAWGDRNVRQYFHFWIQDDRAFVARRSDAAFQPRVDLPVSVANVRKDGWNRLVIQKFGDQFRFLINGELVHEMRFFPFLGNGVELSASNGLVAFDDLEVVQAPPEAVSPSVKIGSRLNCGLNLNYKFGIQSFPSTGIVTEVQGLPAGEVTYAIQGTVACDGILCNAAGVGLVTLRPGDVIYVEWLRKDLCEVRLSTRQDPGK